jgi:hypothetical protein
MTYNKATLLSGNYCIQVDTQDQWRKLCEWLDAPEHFGKNKEAKCLYTHEGNGFSWSAEPSKLSVITLIHYSAIDFSEELKVGDKVAVRGYEGEVGKSSDEELCAVYFSDQDDACGHIFNGINKRGIQMKALGYDDRGAGLFPYCRTLSDLTQFINALNNLDMEQQRKITHYICPKDILRTGWYKGAKVFPERHDDLVSELIKAFFTPVYEPLVKEFPNGKVTVEGTVTAEELKSIVL